MDSFLDRLAGGLFPLLKIPCINGFGYRNTWKKNLCAQRSFYDLECWEKGVIVFPEQLVILCGSQHSIRHGGRKTNSQFPKWKCELEPSVLTTYPSRFTQLRIWQGLLNSSKQLMFSLISLLPSNRYLEFCSLDEVASAFQNFAYIFLWNYDIFTQIMSFIFSPPVCVFSMLVQEIQGHLHQASSKHKAYLMKSQCEFCSLRISMLHHNARRPFPVTFLPPRHLHT